MKVALSQPQTEAAGAVPGPPDTRVSVRKIFGIDSDMEAPAYSAPALLPAAAAANHALFYVGVAPRSVRGLLELIADRTSQGVER